MWTPLAFAMALVSAAAPERVLLIEDAPKANFERTLVHQQLFRNLMRDPATQLLGHALVPTHLHRTIELLEAADLLVGEARRHLHNLDLKHAAISSSAAALRYGRVAELCGDITGLSEALSLNAAAHLLQGHTQEANEVLIRLLTLDASYVPSPTLFNHAMQQTVRNVAGAMHAAAHQWVQLTITQALGHNLTAEAGFFTKDGNDVANAAVFVDGQFAGFGSQKLQLMCGVAHYIWIVPQKSPPQGLVLQPNQPGAKAQPSHCFAAEVSAVLWPQTSFGQGANHAGPFGHVLSASHLATGEVDPYHPSLASRQVDSVLVLSYVKGALRLTTFELRQGQRRVRETAAVITHLWDVNRIADALLAPTPKLTAVP